VGGGGGLYGFSGSLAREASTNSGGGGLASAGSGGSGVVMIKYAYP
jgi:hypothetical protein